MDQRIIEWTQYGETVISPLALGFAIIMWILVFTLKREYKIVPYLLLAFLIPFMQRFTIFGINFPLLRIAILLGIVMIFLNNEMKLKLNKIDKVMICYGTSRIVINTVLRGSAGFIEQSGYICDSVLIYFLFRFIFQDIKDYNVLIKTLFILCLILSFFILNEKMTGRNFFSVFGDIPEYTMVREGKLRAQASFSHPIIAGTFGALMIPFLWIMWNNKRKLSACIGFICALIITMGSASSGPFLTLLTCFFGISLWIFRRRLKLIIRASVFLLILTQILIKRPIWWLLVEIDFSGGSTGYFRANLIDAAIKNFPKWFLFGSTGSAGWGWGLQDITNNYIAEGLTGGLLTLLLFIYIIKLCFNYIGKALDDSKDNIKNQKIIWALGVILFSNVVTFIGISYFGYFIDYYYLQLSMISSLNNITLTDNSKTT